MQTRGAGTMAMTMTPGDPLSSIIKIACVAAIKEAFHISDLSPRRLLNVEDAAAYLSLSEREVYNMISNKDLGAVRHGRRVMLDIRDLDEWIAIHKAA
ncbi:MAG TPA: helix-turn-helix domain-containing protein [Bryobacteraceae bacterium]|nr:helix-turn-helix domain-containing protein [Bryobacteraceae bacterium]